LILSLPKGSKPLTPCLVSEIEEYIAVVSNTGYLLVISAKEVPMLVKGKGNKLINIPSAKVIAREEYVVDVIALNENQTLIVETNSKPINLKPEDWMTYLGERGRRGNKLPRNYRQVKKLIIKK